MHFTSLPASYTFLILTTHQFICCFRSAVLNHATYVFLHNFSILVYISCSRVVYWKELPKKSFNLLLPAVPIRLLAFFPVFQQVTAQFNTMAQTSVKSEPYAAKYNLTSRNVRTIPTKKCLAHRSLPKCMLSFCILSFEINVNQQRKLSQTHLPKLNLQHYQRQCVFVCHPDSLPTARGQDDNREAGMALWALDYRNPARFHVVSIQPEAGHCYRFHNRNDYKTQTACIHVLGLMGRPFPNGLIHLPEKCEDRIVTIICRAACSLSSGAVPPRPQVHLPGMFALGMKKEVMIKVIPLTIRIRAAERVRTVEWASTF